MSRSRSSSCCEGSVQGSSVVERGPVPAAFNLIPFIEKDLGGFLLFKGHFVPFCFYFALSSVFSLTFDI